jgi:hypothetical protein
VARVPRRRSATLRAVRAAERAERSAEQAERSAAAHGSALPTPGAGTGRGDTGPHRCGGNHAHSTKRPVPVRRADRPAITVRTARSTAATRTARADSVAVAPGTGRGGTRCRPGKRSSPRRLRRGLDRSREVRSAADAEHLRAANRAGALGSGLTVLHRDLLCVLHLALCLALYAVRLGHSGSLPFVTVDVVGPLARRSSVTSDTGSAQPSGADSSNPADPRRRELAQR